jgi:polyhydroxybutyrate depolymerase
MRTVPAPRTPPRAALPFGTAPSPTDNCCPAQGCDFLDSSNPCSFNAGACCGHASSTGTQDVVFAVEMIEWMAQNSCLDPSNVFATGFSNGGMITNRVGCQLSPLFKGIAPVAGNIRTGGDFEECAPSTSLSWISFCGASDGVCNSDFDEAALTWGRLNNCATGPLPTFVSATTRCEAWTDCDDGSFVEKCLIDDLGHEWPGRPRPDGNSPPQAPSNVDATMYMFQRWSTLV